MNNYHFLQHKLNERMLRKAEFLGTLITIAAGVVLHFVYDWSGENPLLAPVVPVNESIWEHLKLLFFPFILYSIPEFFLIGKRFQSFVAAKFLGVTAGMWFIVICYYTYSGIIGDNYVAADISIFVLSVILAFFLSCLLCEKLKIPDICNWASFLLLIGIALLFFRFTVQVPELAIFAEP